MSSSIASFPTATGCRFTSAFRRECPETPELAGFHGLCWSQSEFCVVMRTDHDIDAIASAMRSVQCDWPARSRSGSSASHRYSDLAPAPLTPSSLSYAMGLLAQL